MLNTYFRICKIVEANQIPQAGQEGRKRLQKIAFVSKSLGYPVPGPFIFHSHGPYSPALAAQLNDARDFGLLRGSLEEPYRLSEKGVEFARTFLLQHPDEKQPLKIVDRVAAEIGAESTTNLELLATVFYLAAVGYEGPDQTAKKVEELKPQRFSREEIASAVETRSKLQALH